MIVICYSKMVLSSAFTYLIGLASPSYADLRQFISAMLTAHIQTTQAC